MMAWVGKRSIWAVVITAAGKVGRKSGRAESVPKAAGNKIAERSAQDDTALPDERKILQRDKRGKKPFRR